MGYGGGGVGRGRREWGGENEGHDRSWGGESEERRKEGIIEESVVVRAA